MTSEDIPLLVLAGGFGTRLRSAVANVPKTLAPVAGRPFLDYLLKIWIQQGIRKFTFLLHYEAEKIIGYLNTFLSEQNSSVSIDWIIEQEPLGTGGSIGNAIAIKQITGAFMVVNSDTWLSSGIAELRSALSPAMTIIEVENSDRYGQVLHAKGLIRKFVEKKQSAGRSWVNAGLYKLDTILFQNWNGKAFNLENDLFPGLAEKQQLHACPLVAEFIDIGLPEDYKKFQAKVEPEGGLNAR